MTPAVDGTSVLDLLSALVRIPSRGGIDSCEPILGLLASWFRDRGLPTRTVLGPAGTAAGLVCSTGNASTGRHLVLNACIDTAPFGDEARWRHPPTSAHIEGDWLFGRGSADSKVAAAVFAHLIAETRTRGLPQGTRLSVLFDADEHTGGFAGARGYFGPEARSGRVDGVMIGYPGSDAVVIGARGFLRAQLLVYGTAGHSGSSRSGGENAVEKAGLLITLLSRAPLPTGTSADFPLAPKLTVTQVQGGEGYTMVPDRCAVLVDVRLTPAFQAEDARRLLGAVRDAADDRFPTRSRTALRVDGGWPAYRLGSHSPLSAALTEAASQEFQRPVATKIAGPSNIANYLASLDIPATCGFGVRYRDLHATDECIDLTTLAPVHRTYGRAAYAFLLASGSPTD